MPHMQKNKKPMRCTISSKYAVKNQGIHCSVRCYQPLQRQLPFLLEPWTKMKMWCIMCFLTAGQTDKTKQKMTTENYIRMLKHAW